MDLNYSYAATAGASGAATTAGNSGQLMAITSSPASTINGQARNQTFTYDDLGRLTTATGWVAWQRRFAYDRWGNRTGVWNATSGGTQIQSVTLQQQSGAPTGVPSNRAATITNNGMPSPQTYDAAGNLTNDGLHSYQYDGENRIAKVDAGMLNEADYFYDSSNWRVKKTTSNNTYTSYCIWEGGQVIAEYSNAPAGSSGNSYYLADRQSNRMITEANGAFKGTQDQLPFGEDAGTTGTTEKHRFTNYERDSESGTDYATNRQYGTSSGRFMRPDPIQGDVTSPQSLNRYVYTDNDPTNWIDPLGLKKCFDSEGNETSCDSPGAIEGDDDPIKIRNSDRWGFPEIGPAPRDRTSWLGLFLDWIFNRGEKNRQFGPTASMTKYLKRSPGVQHIREEYCQQVASGGKAYYQRLSKWGLGLNPENDDGVIRADSWTRQFVGSFTLTIEETGDTTTFTAYNETSMKSALYHIPGVQNVRRGEGPGATMSQTYFWFETNPCGK